MHTSTLSVFSTDGMLILQVMYIAPPTLSADGAQTQVCQQKCMEASCGDDVHLSPAIHHCDCKHKAWMKDRVDTVMNTDQQSLLATKCNCMCALALLS